MQQKLRLESSVDKMESVKSAGETGPIPYTQQQAQWGKVVSVQCRFTSTEAIRTIRDGEPGMATSLFTRILSSYRGKK